MGREATRVARIQLPDGTPVWARISGSEAPEGPSLPSGELSYTDTGFAERVEASVENLHSLIVGVARSLAGPLRAVRPDEASVEFGIELTAKAGKIVGLLADGEAKAGITVTLTWSGGGPPDPARSSPAPDPAPTGSAPSAPDPDPDPRVGLGGALGDGSASGQNAAVAAVVAPATRFGEPGTVPPASGPGALTRASMHRGARGTAPGSRA